MKREDKQAVIDQVAALLREYSHFYITDITALNAQETSDLRRICFNSDIKLLMVKNKLMIKALDSIGPQYSELYSALKGTSAIMFSNVGSAPGKLIRDIRKTKEKPLVKGAYVEESIFLGDAQLETLATLKTKEELVGEIIGLLQSPAKNVVSALQSGGNILHGILKTLSEKQ